MKNTPFVGGYSRAAVVEGTELAVDDEERELHRKEFGDLLWYVSRFLESQDVTIGDALGVLFADNGQQFNGTFGHLDSVAAQFPEAVRVLKPGHEELAVQKETTSFYSQAFTNLCEAADLAMRAPHSEAAKYALLRRAGVLLWSMSWIVQNRLDTTMAEVAATNLQKIESRNRNGTVFGNGDRRL